MVLLVLRYDDDVEKSLEAANLTKEERAEASELRDLERLVKQVEKNLDDLLNHSNITLYQAFSMIFISFELIYLYRALVA